MWRRVPGLIFCDILQTRTYVPRAGNLSRPQYKKTLDSLEGKVRNIQKFNNDETKNMKINPEELINSPEYMEDPEGFGDFESDFMQTHKLHNEYLEESERHKEQIRHKIVKNKYFKEHLPNFLTYTEKEQIKLLNNRDPDEWTPEKLSESFPASPAVIWKVLKAKWVARSEQRIKLHDQHVMRNWNLLKEGKFTNLNKDLMEHLQKFANRTPEDLSNFQISDRSFPKLPTPKTTEFVSIITSCKKYQEKLLENGSKNTKSNNKEIVLKEGLIPPNQSKDEDTFLMGKICDKRTMRLEDFKSTKLHSIEENNVHLDETINDNTEDTSAVKMSQENQIEKIKTTEIVVSKEDMKTYEISSIKERIYIPRKLRKRGATYKVEDCYYDDDGEFLYRVPGMTGKRI